MEYETFDSMGYDSFIGRATYGDIRRPGIVHLDLHGLGSGGFLGADNLEEALNYALVGLCKETKNGRRTLLTKSPGSLPVREHKTLDVRGILRNLFEDHSIKPRPVWNQSPPQTFETLSREELEQFEAMYNQLADMKNYPNPFLDQPE